MDSNRVSTDTFEQMLDNLCTAHGAWMLDLASDPTHKGSAAKWAVRETALADVMAAFRVAAGIDLAEAA